MSVTCPEWRPLLAHRFDAALEAPGHWPAAEAHLEQCAECRRAAMAIDPTLAFRGAAVWASTAGESAAILQAVRTLRRTADLESRTEGAGGEPAARPRSRERGRLAAAAVFALVLALKPAITDRIGVEPTAVLEPAPAAQLLRAARPAAPAIEGVDRPGARVYEWGADDLSVVMVVDESLDV